MKQPSIFLFCALFFSIGTHLDAASLCDIPFVESQIDTIGSVLGTCCTTMSSKSEFIFSTLDECSGGSSCSSIVITSGGTLSTVGATYCLAQDITGSITINASNITLNLNGHALTGIINVTSSAPYATITDGYITSAAPTTTTDAAIPAITIGADSCTISHCTIACADSTTAVSSNGLPGRTAISLGQQKHTTITDCSIYAGAGANGTAVSGTKSGGNGGNAISGVGSYTKILRCTITSGRGGNGGTGAIGSTAGGAGGTSGYGLSSTSADYILIKECLILTGSGGSGGQGLSGSSAGPGGAGSASSSGIILNIVLHALVEECVVITGTGGNGGTGGNNSSGPAGGGGAGGNSATAVSCSTVSNSYIQKCTLEVGGAGNGGNDALAPNSSLPGAGGNGGSAGNCITIGASTNNVTLEECLLKTGSGGNGGSVLDAVNGAGAAGAAGAAGHGIFIPTSTKNIVRKCSIQLLGAGGAGGRGGHQTSAGTHPGGPGGNGGAGGHGIYFNDTSSTTEVRLCTMENGSLGGAGGFGGGGTPPGATGTPGTPGQAIYYGSEAPSFTDTIFQNVAHHIANTTAYRICNKGLSLVDTGTSIYSSPGVYDNVYE